MCNEKNEIAVEGASIADLLKNGAHSLTTIRKLCANGLRSHDGFAIGNLLMGNGTWPASH